MRLSRAGSSFERFYVICANDIFAFCRAFNFKPNPDQVPLLQAAQDATVSGATKMSARYLACKSGQGVGKTTAMVMIAVWRAFRRFRALSVLTAPTLRQCKEVFLSEFRNRLEQAPKDVARFFECRATEIEILGVDDWGVKMFSASKPENAQGWHNDYMTFVVDEASGVGRSIVETIMGTLTNQDRMLCMFGNPNTRNSAFFDCFNRDRRNWTTFTINAEKSSQVDHQNINRMAELYGKESDIYRVRVLGEFPLSDPNCIMSSDDLEACARNSMIECAKKPGMRQFGIDFARYGDDFSVIYRRSGLAIVEMRSFAKTEPDRVIATAFEMQKRAAWRDNECVYVMDADGLGQGVAHHFHNNHKRTEEFHFGGTDDESSIYHDKVTGSLFRMAQLVKARSIYIPDDSELIQQLSTRQYNMTLKGKIKAESKEEYKDREQNGSPDKADAAVMAFYDRILAQGQVARAS